MTPETYTPSRETTRAAWKATGLTQAEIGRRLGVNARQVRSYMTGERETPFLFYFALCSLGT